jgi:DNA ligase (NAD+)
MNLSEFFEENDEISILNEYDAEQSMRGYNTAYRAGTPLIPDLVYDTLLAKYAREFPNNPFFNQLEIEPEELVIGKTVKLPQRMLSTNKAYSHKEIEKFLNDCEEVGKKLGVKEVLFRITPKLDGFAGYYKDKKLYTRGNGYEGTDISIALQRGLNIFTPAQMIFKEGPGEIVVHKGFFKETLTEDFENSRNVISSVIKEGELDSKIKTAINTRNVIFYPFSNLYGWMENKEGVLNNLEIMWDTVATNCDFDTDGLVIEAISEKIKSEMGATNHHHKWMLAYKKNTESHEVIVTGLTWQTGTIGRITPVVELVPTKISGVTISRATGHNFANVVKEGIDAGATVQVVRSGLVIPYIQKVIIPSDNVSVPEFCPSCGAETIQEGVHLLCSNTIDCPAQIEGILGFFFKTIGNCDGFGPAIIEKLHNFGYDNIVDICEMDQDDFYKVIGGKTAENLFKALKKSRQLPIEDWRFLAAFSLDGHGKGNCEKLLMKYALEDIFKLTVDDIITIDGFAEKSASALVNSLKKIKRDFEYLLNVVKFNLVETIRGGKVIESPIAGKVVVFTGTMLSGSRNSMIDNAKALGANVGTTVTSKTNILVCGEKVGASKTNSAKKNGTLVLSEVEYLELIK